MVPAMESLAKDMVEKCRGLPLAIVVLSGLLSHKKGIGEWRKLWMAEGFIPRGEERMEDVAEGFLNELIRRSLVQVASTFWEKVTDCRVHDLLRDLAIQKALEVNFFDVYDPRSHSISSLCIRHAIHSQGERYLSLDLSNLKLRGKRETARSVSKFHHNDGSLEVKTHGRSDAYFGNEIMCSDNSFRQLEFLHLYDLWNLETWHLATSAMPLIKGLAIDRCPKLKEIPESMKDVEEKLNVVDLYKHMGGFIL
ncbi:hypothetical protein R3W88_010922 [Solanum pinnatisectum]|uniref:Disease resistance protein winged helix domain-containing protein n=1 Tax=Solanum pinnatisectum TaxID=50273 RepID=A0AAV9L5E4_9SOLN|nr:hypothetical protein R3W88_010922 [Solanum pinnatisectum]